MGIKLQSSSGGSVEIAAPVTASNYVLTAPAVSGTLALQGGTGVGKVLQVVQGSVSVEAVSSSSTYADTGLTATITPTSATSRVLVIVQQNGCAKQSSDTFLYVRLLRNGTEVVQFGRPAAWTLSTSSNAIGTIGISFLDSPNTTSAITYKTQFMSAANTAAVKVQQDGLTLSTITLMEIAG